MVELNFGWKSRTVRDAAKRLADLTEDVVSNLEAAMEKIGLRVEAAAKRLCPVDTGTLRASISSGVQAATKETVKAIVGSNLEYSSIQEVSQPYLRPAFEQNKNVIRREIEDALDDARGSFL